MLRKKVGLALGSGVAKGFAHIGVLKVLEKNKIPIDFISGTSAGSIVAALYASNPNIEEVESLALKTNISKLIDWNIPTAGLIKGNRFESYLREKINSKKIEDLKIPLFITSVDLNTGHEVIFNKGDIAKAVRASISIPGIFNPAINKDKVLIDGAWKDTIPVEVLKEAGAEIIIAVNLNEFSENEKAIYLSSDTTKESAKLPNIFYTLLRSYQISEEELIKTERNNPIIDILIEPNLSKIKPNDFNKAKQAIKLGEEATEKIIDNLKVMVKEGGIIKKIISKIRDIGDNAFDDAQKSLKEIKQATVTEADIAIQDIKDVAKGGHNNH
ncbi:MAG: patatin-like phospholipase family protein [Candidatus Pacearchaeota archaeon]